ncbi:MAG: FecR domain-containing protein [Methylacidiphilales bacterium]|nr:FecR domain-containing protein [Candidatus Methylacidiphilales bacterium]
MNAFRFISKSLGILAFLIIAHGLAQADTVPATVSYVKGDAYFVNASGQSQKITENMQVPPGTTITTGANGTVGLRLVPGTTTVVGPNTSMKVDSLDYSQAPSGEKKRKILLDLTKGTVYSSLIKHDGESDFRISTPEGVAAARGTDWSVTVSGSTVSVSVVDGTVVIDLPNGHTIDIPAGKVGVSTTGTGANLTYVITGLTDAEKNKIIQAIIAAGFNLSGQNGPGGLNFTNQGPGVTNPANISVNPTVSPTY